MKHMKKAPALPLFFEGFSILAGVLIGHFVFDQLLFGLCFGAAAGIALAMISELIRTSRKKQPESPAPAAEKTQPAPPEKAPAEAEPLPQTESENAAWERRR